MYQDSTIDKIRFTYNAKIEVYNGQLIESYVAFLLLGVYISANLLNQPDIADIVLNDHCIGFETYHHRQLRNFLFDTNPHLRRDSMSDREFLRFPLRLASLDSRRRGNGGYEAHRKRALIAQKGREIDGFTAFLAAGRKLLHIFRLGASLWRHAVTTGAKRQNRLDSHNEISPFSKQASFLSPSQGANKKQSKEDQMMEFVLPAYHAPDFTQPALARAPDVKMERAQMDGVAPRGYHSTSMYYRRNHGTRQRQISTHFCAAEKRCLRFVPRLHCPIGAAAGAGQIPFEYVYGYHRRGAWKCINSRRPLKENWR